MFEYFFSRAFRGVKFALAVTGGIACGIIIVMGVLGNSIVIPICGGIALLPMGFIFFENIKVLKDMENLVTQFKNETKTLKQTNEELKQTSILLSNEVDSLKEVNEDLKHTEVLLGNEVNMLKDERLLIDETKNKLVAENDKLERLLNDAEKNLDNLKIVATQYQETSTQLGKNLKSSELNNEQLKIQLGNLIDLKEEYKSQNNELKSNYNQAIEQLELIKTVKEDYEIQLKQLTISNEELKNNINLINGQYENAKAALKTLLQATGVLEDLGKNMVETEQKTQENVTMTNRILNLLGINRSTELFNKLDTNEDRMLSYDEFIKILNENNKDDIV